MTEIPELILPHFLKPALSAGHPWVYRSHVPAPFRAPDGAWVRVRAGNWSGTALWDATSPIALRVYAPDPLPGGPWIAERVEQALALREQFLDLAATTAYRLIFGEGDHMPAITVDRYDDVAVVLSYATSVERLIPAVVEALTGRIPLSGVVRRAADPDAPLTRLWGRLPPDEVEVRENGLRLIANLGEGQKSGLFLDHRDNRRTVERLAAGKRVLNLYGYTGAFSLYALRGGATHVTTVDSAAVAIEDARRNFRLNDYDDDAHDFVVADVVEFLEEARAAGRRWDLVICDPPSLARSRKQREGAIRAYTRLNELAASVTTPGGLLATASCTSQVAPADFLALLADAARRTSRPLQIVHEAGHAPDHPVLAAHPEGRYLKFVVARVGA